jgi:hypothetical protein
MDILARVVEPSFRMFVPLAGSKIVKIRTRRLLARDIQQRGDVRLRRR